MMPLFIDDPRILLYSDNNSVRTIMVYCDWLYCIFPFIHHHQHIISSGFAMAPPIRSSDSEARTMYS